MEFIYICGYLYRNYIEDITTKYLMESNMDYK
jgi:hypothetical protein